MSERWLFAGLGNPGKKYQNNRHNIGFLLVDHFLKKHGSLSFKVADGAEVASVSLRANEGVANEIFLIKPQEFMNNSGRSIAAFMRYREIKPSNLVVIHDEVEIPFDTMRFKLGGGNAGHNGIKSTSAHLGTGEFFRRTQISTWRTGSFQIFRRKSHDNLMTF